MRDGTVLRADVYRPTTGDGPWPVLLARSPYGRSDAGVLERLDPDRAAGRGFLVVIQDCRGRFGSEGDWTPLAHEAADGYDTIAWAARLPDADGRVAMYGPSYLGHTQWAAASAGPPALRVVVPEFTWDDPFDGLLARGGTKEIGLVTQWTLGLGVNVLERRFARRPGELRRALAQVDAAFAAFPSEDAIRELRLPLPRPRPTEQADVAGVPALIVAGWYDCFLQGSLDRYIRAHTNGTPVSLIVGPWAHGSQAHRVCGDPLLDHELDWVLQQLGPETPAPEQYVLVYVTGADAWRRMPHWPPESAETSWFLHDGGVFLRDPDDPVVTHGGAVLLTQDFPAGPHDQRQVEEREDVLVYTSEPLKAPLEVIGRVRVYLTGESTAPVTDWVARLCDVDSDGVSRNISDGILRTHQPDAQEHVIDLWSIAHMFAAGHRIRLQVTGSCFPRWDLTPAARQTVHCDPARPSRLVLPIVF